MFPWFWLPFTSITIYVFDHYFFVLFKLLLLSAFLKNKLGLLKNKWSDFYPEKKSRIL